MEKGHSIECPFLVDYIMEISIYEFLKPLRFNVNNQILNE